MTNLLQTFREFIQKENLFRAKDRLLLAVSGGVDSVVLCELCKQAGYDFAIAHCNFQLRDAESDGDETFVKELASHYAVPFLVKKFDTATHAREYKLSIQEAARELRYTWFTGLLSAEDNKSENPYQYIVTAHHANDNVETLLMNFFKGTGIQGLQGMQAREGGLHKNITRPLLFARKQEILSFATEHNLLFREDSSNTSIKYSRNFIRNEVMPLLQQVYPAVEDNLVDNIARYKDVQVLYRQAVDAICKKIVHQHGLEMHMPVLKLAKTAALPTVLFEITRSYGFTPGQLPGIIQLLSSESGKYIDSATHRILRNRKWLIMAPLQETGIEHYLLEEQDNKLVFGKLELMIEKKSSPQPLDVDTQTAMIDMNEIRFPLMIRRWKRGDYFYPLGMAKKKKLSRFFIDQKMSLIEKENTWVIESDKRIVWVIGRRIDDRFKVKISTTQILKFQVKSQL
ncbi:MAG TPA: tRNA lysidine(34) synthetase TilS [Ferruginibacter sp.]|nr:tRNA lysidine(34) synthetase TilS [Ferruginibacter sp.]